MGDDRSTTEDPQARERAEKLMDEAEKMGAALVTSGVSRDRMVSYLYAQLCRIVGAERAAGEREERVRAARLVRFFLAFDSQRAVSWHEVQDCAEAISHGDAVPSGAKLSVRIVAGDGNEAQSEESIDFTPVVLDPVVSDDDARPSPSPEPGPVNTHCVLCMEPVEPGPQTALVHKPCAFKLEVDRVCAPEPKPEPPPPREWISRAAIEIAEHVTHDCGHRLYEEAHIAAIIERHVPGPAPEARVFPEPTPIKGSGGLAPSPHDNPCSVCGQPAIWHAPGDVCHPPAVPAPPSRPPEPPTVEAGELLERAWGIIANAGEGSWDRESAEWRGAAARWREDYFAAFLPGVMTPATPFLSEPPSRPAEPKPVRYCRHGTRGCEIVGPHETYCPSRPSGAEEPSRPASQPEEKGRCQATEARSFRSCLGGSYRCQGLSGHGGEHYDGDVFWGPDPTPSAMEPGQKEKP